MLDISIQDRINLCSTDKDGAEMKRPAEWANTQAGQRKEPMAQTSTPTQAIITLKTRRIGTMAAIYLGPDCLVESETTPGTWYVVDSVGRCSCPSYTFRGHCKHTAVAETAAEIERREAVPVQPELCQCGRSPWTVKMAGCLYCGRCAPRPALSQIP